MQLQQKTALTREYFANAACKYIMHFLCLPSAVLPRNNDSAAPAHKAHSNPVAKLFAMG